MDAAGAAGAGDIDGVDVAVKHVAVVADCVQTGDRSFVLLDDLILTVGGDSAAAEEQLGGHTADVVRGGCDFLHLICRLAEVFIGAEVLVDVEN